MLVTALSLRQPYCILLQMCFNSVTGNNYENKLVERFIELFTIVSPHGG